MDIELQFTKYGDTFLAGWVNLSAYKNVQQDILPFILRDVMTREGAKLFTNSETDGHAFISAGHNIGEMHYSYLMDTDKPVIEFLCSRDFAITLAQNGVSGLVSPYDNEYFVRCYLGNHIPTEPGSERLVLFCSMMHDIVVNTRPFYGPAPTVLLSLDVLRRTQHE